MSVIKNFLVAETGAVTVDWVVLTAALVGLGLAVMAVVGDGVNSLTNSIADELADTTATTGSNHGITRTTAAAAAP